MSGKNGKPFVSSIYVDRNKITGNSLISHLQFNSLFHNLQFNS
jgi:hypothetical protein